MANATEMESSINAARTMEALEKEAGLRFGARVKISYDPEFPIGRIIAPNEANYRFATGMVVAGVKLESDLRNIAGMADDIRALRGITNPLVVSLRANAEPHLCQGFRRFGGINLIREQEDGSPLANKLANVPCIIYEGLSLEQERQLTNDQTSKTFSSAEVFGIFEEQIRGGFNWLNICERMYNQIGQVTGSMENVRKIDALTDPKKRQEELRTWLQSTAYQGWYNGIKAGPVVRNLWMQTYLWKDGFKGVPRPRVLMDAKRMKGLWTHVQADQTAGEFNAELGTGPRLCAELEKLAETDAKSYNEDGSKKTKTRDPNAEKMKSLADVQELIFQEEPNDVPSLLSSIYRITLKNGGNPEATRLVRNFDKCRSVFNQHRAFIKPELSTLLALVFDGVDGSQEKLMELMATNYVSQPEAVATHELIPENNSTPVVVQEVETVRVQELPAVVQEVETGDTQIATEMPVTVDNHEDESKGHGHAKKPTSKHKAGKK